MGLRPHGNSYSVFLRSCVFQVSGPGQVGSHLHICSEHTLASNRDAHSGGQWEQHPHWAGKAAQHTQVRSETRRDAQHPEPPTPTPKPSYTHELSWGSQDNQSLVPACAVLTPSCLHSLILGTPWQAILPCHCCGDHSITAV